MERSAGEARLPSIAPSHRKSEPATGQTRVGDGRGPWTVPHDANPHFRGRDEQLAKLTTNLRALTFPVPPVVIHGTAGVGKTQLAVAYAWGARRAYSAVLWVVADSPKAFRANLAQQAAALGLPTSENVTLQSGQVEDWLKEQSGWLLIVDNVDSREASDVVRDFVAPTQRLDGHVIITSQLEEWPPSFMSIGLQTLRLKAATDFLLGRLKRGGLRASVPDARAVAVALGRLPLALEQAASYVLECRITLGQYLKKLAEKSRSLLARAVRGGTRYEKSVFTAWLVTESRLSDVAQRTLHTIAFLAPDYIPRRLFSGDGPAVEELKLAAENDIDSVLGELKTYSLITLDPEAITCHRLVQLVLRLRLAPEEQRPALDRVITMLEHFLPPESHDPSHWDDWAQFSFHVSFAVSEAERLKAPERATRLMVALGAFHTSRAQHDLAEPLLRRALHVLQSQHGVASPKVIDALLELSRLFQETGRGSEARTSALRATAIARCAVGPRDRRLGLCFNALSRAYRRMYESSRNDSESRRARFWVRRAIAVTTEATGPDDPSLTPLYDNLSVLLRGEGALAEAEAEKLLKKATRIATKARGRTHPTIATYRSNLGVLYIAQERWAEADKAMSAALKIDETSSGDQHPRVAVRLNNLARIYWYTRRKNEAIAVLERALRIYGKYRRAARMAHPFEQKTVARYCEYQGQLGKTPRAIKALLDAFGVNAKAAGSAKAGRPRRGGRASAGEPPSRVPRIPR